MLHLSQNCKMRNMHTTLLQAFQWYQTHNKKELSLKLPCLCALVWPCVSSSILKRSCKVSRMQKKWRHRKAKSKTEGKPPLKTNLHERTSLVPSFCFSMYSCHVPLSRVILWISLIYTVLYIFAILRNLKRPKFLTLQPSLGLLVSSTTSTSHLRLPSMVGANQWVNWGASY